VRWFGMLADEPYDPIGVNMRTIRQRGLIAAGLIAAGITFGAMPSASALALDHTGIYYYNYQQCMNDGSWMEANNASWTDFFCARAYDSHYPEFELVGVVG
jgi:hypothetical protein